MKRLFDSVLKSVVDHITTSPDSALFSEKMEENVYNKFKIELPRLEKERLKIDIGEEIIGFGNAPEGVSFIPGRPMEYALFSIPVTGSKELFKVIVNPYCSDRKTGFDGHNLLYKEITGRKITGNEIEIQQVKENAKNKIVLI